MLPYLHILGHELPTYGVLMVVGFLTACFVAYVRAKRLQCVADENDFIIIAIGTVAAALAGAKLMYIAASYGFGRAVREILRGDFSGLGNTGLVYYGGLLCGVACAAILSKAFKVKMDAFAEACVPVIPLGHAFGRIGCACAGCCYGVPYAGPGALHVHTLSGTLSLFPVQLLESAFNLALFAALVLYTRKRHPGFQTLALYAVPYAVIRFLLEFLRGDSIRGHFFGLSTAQWTSVGLLTLVLCVEAVLFVHKRLSARETLETIRS